MVIVSHHLLFPLLFTVGLLAGTIDAIAGGGGLITVPVLLGLGVPPHVALGTNKMQSFVGTSVAAFSYYRQGWLSLKKLMVGFLFTFLGAAFGALLTQHLSSDILKKIIPLFLLVILLYTLLSPKMGYQDRRPKISENTFFIIFGTLLGFYDGFLGPGVGSFWVFFLTFFLGYNLVKATAHTKIFNLNTNLTALACFIIGHNVDYRIAFFMAVGQLIGGRLGAQLAIKNGAELIRPVFVVVVSGTIATLLYRTYPNAVSLAFASNSKRLEILAVMMTLIAIYLWNARKVKDE